MLRSGSPSQGMNGSNEPVSDAELDAMQQRAGAASKGPWRSFIEGRDHTSGDDFIRVGEPGDGEADMYVSRDRAPASGADLDFIASARQDVPRLIAEIKRLRRGHAGE
jgi:hypothetical protein